ncbi:MAG: carboxy terminal-processing peptidase [Bacteroidetes bacterium]|nr:carboxy terminal-processing peptidase [Bacteroidota bacterium]
MKRLPIVILVLMAGVFLAFQSMGTAKKTPPNRYEEILRDVGEMLKEGHYSPQDINDAFSKKIFKSYLSQLDESKNLLLQSDIDSLRKYETTIDDEIKGAPVTFFLAAGKLFNKRMEEAALIYPKILSRPFNFSVDEKMVLNPDKLDYASTEKEREEMWRKRLKYMTLERYAELLDMRDKNKGKQGFVAKSDEELEKEARQKVQNVMDRTFDRYRHKFTDDDQFNMFVETITSTMDPHTEYFPPVEKRYFDEQMSGTFFGIGASLLYDDGNIKIGTLITGSPAWKSGEIQVGDIIMKVGQGKEEPVELTGYDVTDAVKIIRGKEGTEVRLTLKKQDGSVKVVSLIRKKIVQDETFARSAIVKNGTEKIGYIYLPEFYADFEHANGARCAVDVAKEIVKLKQEHVDGIVMDLRSNGGGSLYDVVQMVGLFIDKGPVVQVRDREGKATVLPDKDPSVLYDGPLAVMVNEFSASASEIFAAAIQDYDRGVIIGSTTTYGKGTVQRNIGLDPESGFTSSNSDLGTVKLTLQKFYRINGGSTQLKGVASDVVLPDTYEYYKYREKDDPNALPWDEISKADYKKWDPGYDLNSIKNMSNQRLENNPAFKLISESSAWLAKQNDEDVSLQLDKYRSLQKQIRTTVQQVESLSKLTNPLDVAALPGDSDKYADDKDKQDRYNQWYNSLKKDIYLDQAVKVMNDMITQRNVAISNGQGNAEKKAF